MYKIYENLGSCPFELKSVFFKLRDRGKRLKKERDGLGKTRPHSRLPIGTQCKINDFLSAELHLLLQ